MKYESINDNASIVERETMLIAQVERYCWSMRPGVLAGCAASTVTQNSFPWQQTAGCCCSRPSSEWLKHFHGHNRWPVSNNNQWNSNIQGDISKRRSNSHNTDLQCKHQCAGRNVNTTPSLDPSWSEIPVSDLEEEQRVVSKLSVGKHQRSVNMSPHSHTLQLQLSRAEVGFSNIYIDNVTKSHLWAPSPCWKHLLRFRGSNTLSAG